MERQVKTTDGSQFRVGDRQTKYYGPSWLQDRSRLCQEAGDEEGDEGGFEVMNGVMNVVINGVVNGLMIEVVNGLMIEAVN